jgi:phage shock protein A
VTLACESLTSPLVELIGAVGDELMRREMSRTLLMLLAVVLALAVLWWVSSREITRALDADAPEQELERAVRETDRLIEELRARLGKLLATKHLAKKHLLEATRKHAELSTQIDQALQHERDGLARAAIATQLDLEAQVAALKQSIATARTAENELQTYTHALLQTRREVQAELETLKTLKHAQESQGPASVDTYQSVMARAPSASGAALARQDDLLAGRSVPDAHGAVRLAELEKATRDERIRARLSALKARKHPKNSP